MTDFDFQSFNLALNQDHIEFDLFHDGLARFSAEEFKEAGLGPDYQFLIEYMANQEAGHADLIVIYPRGAKPCTYQYPFNTVREYLDFCQRLTRWGESHVYGFLLHLDNRMTLRQFLGLFPMAVYSIAGIPQALSCPSDNPRIDPIAIRNDSKAAESTNVSSLSYPGYEVNFIWENPGQNVSYDNCTRLPPLLVRPRFASASLNAPLYNVQDNCASTRQPNGRVFGDDTAPIGMTRCKFIALTDPYVTLCNLSLLNPRVVSGPDMYQAG
ncbi:hypothetical protein BS17DRAFT_796509 [Gyrodon lividus]|nr:hypothetical protein BS17DRAFT_796509 [Gyrodon lividus]